MSRNQSTSQNSGDSKEKFNDASSSHQNIPKKRSLLRKISAAILCSASSTNVSLQEYARASTGHDPLDPTQGVYHTHRTHKSNMGLQRSATEGHTQFGLTSRASSSQVIPKGYRRIRSKDDIALHEQPRYDVAWNEQPKDDESMLRLLKHVEGRLTDHILNFYIAAGDETHNDDDDKASEFSRDVLTDLDSYVVNWKGLRKNLESWISVLCAFIARKILTRATTAAKESASPAPREVNNPSAYRKRKVREIAQATYHEMEGFALESSDSNRRLRSMELVVESAMEFALAMKNQPIQLELLWTPLIMPGSAGSTVFDAKTMDAVYGQSRDGQPRASKVGTTVFPGLRKLGGGEGPNILLRAQVLLC